MPKILHEPRENILLAARTELHEKGVNGFNIRDVAKLSGVAIGTIYNYYGDKYKLVVEVVKELFKQKAEETIEAYPESLGLEDGIACIHSVLLAFKKEQEDVLANIFTGNIKEGDIFLPGTLRLLEKALEVSKKRLGEEEKLFVAENILWSTLKDGAPVRILQKVGVTLVD